MRVPRIKLFIWALAILLIVTSCAFNDSTINEIPKADLDTYLQEDLGSEDQENNQGGEFQEPLQSPEPSLPPEPRGTTSIRLRAVGDIMMHGPQITAGLRTDGTYDFMHFFEDIKGYLRNADITIGNLETTINTPERGYGGYPLFRTPEALLDALKYAGFNVITTANNHSFDGREFGVIHTLDMLDKYDFLYTGTARSQEERDSILLIERNDIRVAILAYTYGTNGMEVTIPKDKLPYMVNYLDKELIKADVEKARDAGAEIIIACAHWGDEYIRRPNNNQIKMTEYMASLGIDIVLGSHPHVLQPMEKKQIILEDGTEKDFFVIYSLGNFISNQRNQYRDSGVILELEIIKDYDTGAIVIGDIGYIPTWVYRFANNGISDYRVLPVADFLEEGLQSSPQQRIQAVWNETTVHLGGSESVLHE